MTQNCFIQAQLLKVIPVAMARRKAIGPGSNQDEKFGRQTRRIYVDISVFTEHDAGTGIQRVVREIASDFLSSNHNGLEIVPVAAKKSGYYFPTTLFPKSHTQEKLQSDQRIQPKHGDIFLGLDLSTRVLPRHYSELLSWKKLGVSIQVVVYDLLPALHPEWFTKRASSNFKSWLKTIAIFSDRFHCISHTVNDDLVKWFRSEYKISLEQEVNWIFPLGSNLIATNKPSVKANQTKVAEQSAVRFATEEQSVLMVGTVEPRKGHSDVLDAFNELWKKGSQTRLILVGQPGWNTNDLQNKIVNSYKTITKQNLYSNLLWLKNADDNLLVNIYESVDGVIVASKGEGYGLPIIEARSFGKPVLARDIPIFREVGKDDIDYFSNSSLKSLTAERLQRWLTIIEYKKAYRKPINLTTWQHSSEVLLRNVCSHSC